MTLAVGCQIRSVLRNKDIILWGWIHDLVAEVLVTHGRIDAADTGYIVVGHQVAVIPLVQRWFLIVQSFSGPEHLDMAILRSTKTV